MTTPHPRGTPSFPRLRSALLILAALLLTAFGEAAAQQAPTPITRSVLVYTVSAVIPPSESGAAAMGPLVERLTQDPRLASLSVERNDTRVQARLVARYVFESEADFVRWMSGDGGRRLTEALSRMEGAPSYQVEYRRLPLADLLRLTS
jgi:hypothetical protein